MSLTDAKIRTLKPSDKPFKVSDSHGLYLLVKPGGSRHWYLKYRIHYRKLYVIATLSSVIRKRRPAILINIISLGTGIFYKQYDELNIIFFIRII